MPEATYPSLDEWAHDRIIEGVALPAVGDAPARKVDLEIPDFDAYIARGRIPNPLAAAARTIQEGLFIAEEASPEEREAHFQLRCWVIATHLRKPNLVEELGSEEAAAEWVAAKMPEDHRMALWMRCVHMFSPSDMEGLRKALKGLDALAPFRDGDGRPEPADGGDENGKGS